MLCVPCIGCGTSVIMLPWTARLVEALFPRMRPMADFSETQCMSLQTAIVTRLSVLETGKGDHAKAIVT